MSDTEDLSKLFKQLREYVDSKIESLTEEIQDVKRKVNRNIDSQDMFNKELLKQIELLGDDRKKTKSAIEKASEKFKSIEDEMSKFYASMLHSDAEQETFRVDLESATDDFQELEKNVYSYLKEMARKFSVEITRIATDLQTAEAKNDK